MKKRFRIDASHTEIAAKSTIQKAMAFVKASGAEPPYLLVDKSKVKRKAGLIGRAVKNSKIFYAVKANPVVTAADQSNVFGM